MTAIHPEGVNQTKQETGTPTENLKSGDYFGGNGGRKRWAISLRRERKEK